MAEGSNAENLSSGSARWPKEVLDVMDAYLSLFHHPEGADVDSPCAAFGDCGKLSLSQSQEEKELLVDIGNRGPLPQGWEQHLDLRTGQVYYVDWKSCKRSNVDPRKVLKEANEKVGRLIIRAQERMEASPYLSDEASECCITSSESSFSGGDIWMHDEDDEEDEEDADSIHGIPQQHHHHQDQQQQDEAERKEGIGDHIHCLNLFTPCAAPSLALDARSISIRHAQDGLELLSCHLCLARFVIHRANPWCPSCRASLV